MVGSGLGDDEIERKKMVGKREGESEGRSRG